MANGPLITGEDPHRRPLPPCTHSARTGDGGGQIPVCRKRSREPAFASRPHAGHGRHSSRSAVSGEHTYDALIYP